VIATASQARPADRERLVRRARLLAWGSLAWMTAEGVVAVVAGVAAGSIALVGFGLDSAIEGLASVVIIWRFWGARAFSERAERRAQTRPRRNRAARRARHRLLLARRTV